MSNERDVAVVLSGGAFNGVLMELGFLRRLQESPLWARTGWIFGTSAGALAGTMAVTGRLDDLERFLFDLRPEQAFRPNRLWRLPLLGTHDYTLPDTIAKAFGGLTELARELVAADRELVVCATDVSEDATPEDYDFELTYSSRTTSPELLAQAIVASAAVSQLVLPVRVGDRIATDGAWSRNFPLGHAYDRPEVEMIVAFRYIPRYPRVDAAPLARLRRRLERFRGVPPIRTLIADLREAEARDERGEPPHLVDMIRRLMRIAVMRGTVLEERVADERDQSIRELDRLRGDVTALLAGSVSDDVLRAVEGRFGQTRFPFRHDRLVPRVTVRAAAGEFSLETGLRGGSAWTREAKQALVDRGYALADAELRAYD